MKSMPVPGNIFWLSLLAIVEAIQATIGLGWLLNFFPAKSAFTSSVYAEWQYMLRPEWEVVQYRFFVLAATGFMAFFMWIWRKDLQEEGLLLRFKNFLAVDMLLVFVMLSALFKMSVYSQRPALAAQIFHSVLALALAHKVFFKPFNTFLAEAGGFLQRPQNIVFLRRAAALAFPLFIMAVLSVPNTQAAVARMFFGEQFHHDDSFIMGPALVRASGLRPQVDVISQYGFGLPVVVGAVSKIFGAFSYEHLFKTIVLMTVVYYIAWFFLLRSWYKHLFAAVAAMLFGLKIQMFHPGVQPFIYTLGSTTPLRCWWDIVFFAAMFAYVCSPRRRWLLTAGLACGAQIFYLHSEGVYLFLAYLGLIVLHLLNPRYRPLLFKSPPDGFSIAGLVLAPFACAFGLFVLVIGDKAWSAQFWGNMTEFVEYFLSGYGVIPITTSLKDREFLASLMGFIMPSVYVLTLLIVGSLWFLGRVGRRHVFVLAVCIFGLGQYHYYVVRSAPTSYYAVGLPYAVVLGYWLDAALGRISDERCRRWAGLSAVGVCLYALVTTQQFVSFPNWLNLSRNPYTDPNMLPLLPKNEFYFDHLWRYFPDNLKVAKNSLGERNEGLLKETDFSSDEEMVAAYKKASDFSKDVALIQKLTEPGSRVPIVSSFEIKMLADSKRKPFFYYFPLVISRPLEARSMVRTSIYIPKQLEKTVRQIETSRPKYIFMERIFLDRPKTELFYYYYSSFMYLTDYIQEHYTPVEEGKYLVALRRK